MNRFDQPVQNNYQYSPEYAPLPLQDLAEMEVVLPSLEKQAKIVTLLELVEQEIALLEELKIQKIRLKKELFITTLQRTKSI